MSYSRHIRIEFNHCDPAGIVFYPRYFEMTNSVVENFFREVIGYPYERITMDEGRGVPTVRIACDFRRPSRLGEVLSFSLTVERVGRSSLDLTISAAGPDGAERLSAALTLVWTGTTGRAESWPDDIRASLMNELDTRD